MAFTRRNLVRILVPLLVAALVTIAFVRLTAPKKTASMVEAVATAAALSAGHTVTSNDLTVVKVSKLEPGDVTSPSEATGDLLTVPLAKGEILRTEDLKPKTQATLEQILPPGERAISLSFPTVAAVDFAVKKGDRVDVIATFTASASGVKGLPVSDVLISGLKVLGVAPPAKGGKGGTITFEVTPDQEATLELADQVGTLTLGLRGTNDTTNQTPSVKAGSLQ